MTNTTNKEYIRSIINSIYSIQDLRIEIGNRISSNMRMKITGEASPESDKVDKELGIQLSDITKEYDRITDYLVENNMTFRKFFKEEHGIITSELEMALIKSYKDMIQNEKDMVKGLQKELKNFEIYTQFLTNVKGCGPLMSGIIIAYLDPYKARHCSSFERYVGIDVTLIEKEVDGETVVVGEGTGLKHAKLNKIEYVDKDGETKTKAGLSYNPFVKTKLLGVLVPSFIKTAPNDVYANVYRGIKHRYQNMKQHEDKSLKHIDNMSRRYALKIFLHDLWNAWRIIEGLEVTQPYEVAILGNKPHGEDPSVYEKELEQIELELD